MLAVVEMVMLAELGRRDPAIREDDWLSLLENIYMDEQIK